MSKHTKRDRDTEIYYNQFNAPMLIRINDPKLIRKLNSLAADFPELCRLTEEDECCGSYFEVDKRRISIQVTRPYSEERRKKQSQWAKENGVQYKYSCQSKEGNNSKTAVENLNTQLNSSASADIIDRQLRMCNWEDYNMTVSYNKLWKLLIDKSMSKTEVIRKAGITTNAMAHLGKNEDVRVSVLVKICEALDCTIDDIIELIPEKASSNIDK